MDFWQVVDSRYSVRNFDATVDVPPETMDRILQAAVRAPSAGTVSAIQIKEGDAVHAGDTLFTLG